MVIMTKVKGYVGSEKTKPSLAELQKRRKELFSLDRELKTSVKKTNKLIRRSIKVNSIMRWIGYGAGLFALVIGFTTNIPVLSKLDILFGTFLIVNTFHCSRNSLIITREHKMKVCGLEGIHNILTKQELEKVDKAIAELKPKPVRKKK